MTANRGPRVRSCDSHPEQVHLCNRSEDTLSYCLDYTSSARRALHSRLWRLTGFVEIRRLSAWGRPVARSRDRTSNRTFSWLGQRNRSSSPGAVKDVSASRRSASINNRRCVLSLLSILRPFAKRFKPHLYLLSSPLTTACCTPAVPTHPSRYSPPSILEQATTTPPSCQNSAPNSTTSQPQCRQAPIST